MKGVHPVFHVSVLRKHHPDSITGRLPPTPTPVVLEGEEEWEVDSILDCKLKGKRHLYLVSWKNFGPAENSWEPIENLSNCKTLVDDFNKRFPQAPTQIRRRRRKQ